jgi:adenylate cyclase
LPFDTIFIVNRFLGAVSSAVVQSGGLPNQFLGDGLLALFGLQGTPADACRQAIAAAARVAFKVERLNWLLAAELPQPIRFGIGIHCGDAG